LSNSMSRVSANQAKIEFELDQGEVRISPSESWSLSVPLSLSPSLSLCLYRETIYFQAFKNRAGIRVIPSDRRNPSAMTCRMTSLSSEKESGASRRLQRKGRAKAKAIKVMKGEEEATRRERKERTERARANALIALALMASCRSRLVRPRVLQSIMFIIPQGWPIGFSAGGRGGMRLIKSDKLIASTNFAARGQLNCPTRLY